MTVPLFLLHHHHEPKDCQAAFAAWQGFDSPLRHGCALSTCLAGGHDVWWRVTADDEESALSLLPPFVAARTEPMQAREIEVP
jgi:hypothetical protein